MLQYMTSPTYVPVNTSTLIEAEYGWTEEDRQVHELQLLGLSTWPSDERDAVALSIDLECDVSRAVFAS